MAASGINAVRTYTVPPRWLLDTAQRHGLRVLAGYRTDGRGWRRFPFYYTLLALTEIDLPAARAELRWAAPAAERSLKALRGAGQRVDEHLATLAEGDAY